MVLILVGTVSWAQTVTGQWLHELWLANQKLVADPTTTDKTVTVRGYVYMGFLIGAVEVMESVQWLDTGGISPNGLQTFASAAVGKYLDDHPDQWNLDAVGLIYRALYPLWPGRKAAPYQ